MYRSLPVYLFKEVTAICLMGRGPRAASPRSNNLNDMGQYGAVPTLCMYLHVHVGYYDLAMHGWVASPSEEPRPRPSKQN